MVNLDTGTAVAFVSEGSPLRQHLKTVVGQAQMVMTQTALAEFQQIVTAVGGPREQARAMRFIQRVRIVADNPSPRARGLRLTKTVGAHDIIIFGTGDFLGVITFTADARFVRGAAAQGVHFSVYVHAPVPLTGT